MSPNRQVAWSKAVRCFGCVGRGLQSSIQDEAAVTALEYALFAALIAIVALASIVTLGGAVSDLWIYVSTQVAAAL